MKARLILNLLGDTIAEVNEDIPNASRFVVFSNRVFEFAFTQGQYQYFREQKSFTVRNIDILRNSALSVVSNQKG